jgi:predicted aspartyl protease
MGSFYTGCKMENHKDQKRSAVGPHLVVDTGREFTWVPSEVLERIGVEPVKKDLQLQMANGEIVTRSVGCAVLRVDTFETIDEVVFGQRGNLSFLGARAMEGMNIQLDPRKNRLLAAGPIVAATAIRPETARRMGIVIGESRKPGKKRTVARRAVRPRAKKPTGKI